MSFIIKQKRKYCTKELLKILKTIAVAFSLIIGLILIKYKPLYKVEINGEKIGYIQNKFKLKNEINNYLNNKENEEIAFKTLNVEPKYKLNLVSNSEKANEEEILNKIKENSTTTYTAYGITINEDVKAYVIKEEEAQQIVNELSENYKEENNINIKIKQIYSQEDIQTVNKEEAVKTVNELAEAQIEIEEKQENKEKAIAVINEVAIVNKPVSGTITSRYAEVSRVRSSSHTGLDIAAKTGTNIKACSSGTVIFSENKGTYGKLVKIDHGNGVQTWYAHCSKLYVKKGEKVKAGETIAAVGSTGNSTGSHLHLEIRVKGKPVNPQKYIYK